MRKADIVVALGLMVVGLLALGDSVRIGFGWGMSGPEAGFFPFYMGLGDRHQHHLYPAEGRKDSIRKREPESPWSRKEVPLRFSGYCFLPSG